MALGLLFMENPSYLHSSIPGIEWSGDIPIGWNGLTNRGISIFLLDLRPVPAFIQGQRYTLKDERIISTTVREPFAIQTRSPGNEDQGKLDPRPGTVSHLKT